MSFFSRIKRSIVEHYHILFTSAASNHLRIQEILKNQDGSYNLTLKFDSYSELKAYQKKLRRFTLSLSSAVAMVVVAFIVAPYIMNPNRSSAANFLWTQNSWLGAGTGAAKQYPGDNSGATDYTSKNNIDITSGKITLPTPQPATTGDSTYAGFLVDGFYTADASGIYSPSGTNIATKKPQGATCTSTDECIGNCLGSKCCLDACCGVTSVTDTRDTNNSTYNTVVVGSQCWLARNMNVGTMLANATTVPSDPFSSSAVQKWCQGDSATNCNTYGGLYTWAEANGISATYNTTSYNPPVNNQGICPSGWHIPTDAEMYTLENYLKTDGNTCNSTRSNVYDCIDAGVKLKSGGSSGFNWLLAGANGGTYSGLGGNGYLTSSTQASSGALVLRSVISSSNGVNRYTNNKTIGYSVRCIKN